MILITGGAGFIGSHMARHFLDKGEEVVILDNLSTGKRENIPEGVLFEEGDISYGKSIQKVLRQGDFNTIINLAAISSVAACEEDPERAGEVNIGGVIALLNVCGCSGIKNFIQASSAAVYEPINVYGKTKSRAEKFVIAYGDTYELNAINCRFFNVYGEGGGGVIPTFLKGPIVINGDGEQTRDFIHVSDVVSAVDTLIPAMGDYEPGTYFDIGRGIETSMNNLALMFGDYGDFTWSKAIPGEIKRSCADPSELHKLGWKSKVPLEEGIKRLKEE
jgi:UDP-glucose 4-epimerase